MGKRTQIPESWQKLYARTQSGKASPRQAIKMQCGECIGYDRTEIPKCSDFGCPLHKYRPFKKVVDVPVEQKKV